MADLNLADSSTRSTEVAEPRGQAAGTPNHQQRGHEHHHDQS
jgi:hypothetical protein